MKKIVLIFCIISIAVLPSAAQSKKAEREALALEKFEKAVATVESKDFVILVDPALSPYQPYPGLGETVDVTHFLAYEKEYIILQGYISGYNLPVKLNVSDFLQVADKKGNVEFSMHISGFFHNGTIMISLKKTDGAVADVKIHSTNSSKRFSGEVVPRNESNYLKMPGKI